MTAILKRDPQKMIWYKSTYFLKRKNKNKSPLQLNHKKLLLPKNTQLKVKNVMISPWMISMTMEV